MNIHPIYNDKDYRATLREIDRVWNAPEGSKDSQKLEVLTTLVQKYEETRWPMERPDWDPVDVLNYAIKEMGHTQAELSTILNSRSRASEILHRERALTLEMIRSISETWKIPAELLIKRYKVFAAA